MRLIDADALKHKIDQEEGRRIEPGWYDGIDTCREIIENAPTIYAIPVEWLRNEAKLLIESEDGFNKYVGETLKTAEKYWNLKK